MRFLRSLTFAIGPFIGVLAMAATTPAQDLFFCHLNGANETPPNGSTFVGRGWANFDRATRSIWYAVETNVPGVTMAHIHKGAPGVPGPIIFPLTGGPVLFEGQTPALTDAEIADLYSDQYYFNVHSGAFPAGEIRGQLTKTFTRLFEADLTALNVVPPTGSTGTGKARIVLHEPEHLVTYEVTNTGLMGVPTAAHIHLGQPGINGAIVATLNGTPTGTYKGTALLTDVDAQTMLNGNTYVDIETTSFGSGEIRGQLTLQKEEFGASLTGAEEAPPSFGSVVGNGAFVFDPISSMVTYNVTWTGTGGTSADVSNGVPTTNGPLFYGLVGPPNGPYAGISPAHVASQINELFNARYYVNIHSTSSPGGEVRDQLRQNPYEFGYPSLTSSGLLGRTLRIGSSGAAPVGGSWTAKVFDALPNVFCSLVYGETLDLTPISIAPFAVNPAFAVLWVDPTAGYPTASDTLGYAEMTFAIPADPKLVGVTFPFQWISVDGSKITWSNALIVTVR